jgi:hypothetical protein
MEDSIKLINKALTQHASLTRTFIAMQTAKTNFALSTPARTSSQLETLRKSLYSFSFEMKEHLVFEEGLLIDVLEKESLKLILSAHREINDKLDSADDLLKNTNLGILTAQEFLFKKNEILLTMTELYNCVSEHYAKEDTLLRTKLKELGQAPPSKS